MINTQLHPALLSFSPTQFSLPLSFILSFTQHIRSLLRQLIFMMNSRPIFPSLSGLFPHDQQPSFPYGASYPNNWPALYNDTPNRVASDQPGAIHPPNLPQQPLVSVPQGIASLSDAELTETPMGPPPKRRKKKAPTLRAKDWEPYKARILELHGEQKLPLPKVKTVIEQEFGFTAEYVLTGIHPPLQETSIN